MSAVFSAPRPNSHTCRHENVAYTMLYVTVCLVNGEVESCRREHTDQIDTKSNKVRRVTMYEVTQHGRCSLPVASRRT